MLCIIIIIIIIMDNLLFLSPPPPPPKKIKRFHLKIFMRVMIWKNMIRKMCLTRVFGDVLLFEILFWEGQGGVFYRWKCCQLILEWTYTNFLTVPVWPNSYLKSSGLIATYEQVECLYRFFLIDSTFFSIFILCLIDQNSEKFKHARK